MNRLIGVPLYFLLSLLWNISSLAQADVPEIKTVDADDHLIALNKAGMVSVVLGTGANSQSDAKSVCQALNTFQGKAHFQLVIVADLRDSIAAWVPSIAVDQIRRSLDREAEELRPFFIKNGNNEDPRPFCYLVPDFKGTVAPKLEWNGKPDELHATVYGMDGREIQRWNRVNMIELQKVVRSALESSSVVASR